MFSFLPFFPTQASFVLRISKNSSRTVHTSFTFILLPSKEFVVLMSPSPIPIAASSAPPCKPTLFNCIFLISSQPGRSLSLQARRADDFFFSDLWRHRNFSDSVLGIPLCLADDGCKRDCCHAVCDRDYFSSRKRADPVDSPFPVMSELSFTSLPPPSS